MPFTFCEELPDGSTLNIDQGIFHDPAHLKLQISSGWHSFYLLNDKQVNGVVHFHVERERASSPYRSTFGSFIFSDIVKDKTLTEFILYCESRLIAKKIKSITLKHQPEIYSSEKNARVIRALMQLGYSIAHEEPSAVIPVSDKSFESGLHKSEKKRLRRCRESNLTFEVLSPDQLQKIYTFLETCREEKGYALSMSFNEMMKLVKVFPDRIILTSVIDRNQIAAGNISIRVYDHVLYNFYHDHAGEYDSLSPVVLLNQGLYQYCQNRKIKLLDLGTSQNGGKLNESLLNFKVNLGAEVSRKLTFAKIFFDETGS